MGLQEVSKITLVNANNLNPNQYTVSLLKEAYRVGLVDKNIIDSIQVQIVLILKELILRYTKGESTSVTTETAEKILNSVYYSIDAYIKSFYNPEYNIEVLRSRKIKEIYEEGIKIIMSCFSETKALYDKVLKSKVDVSLIAYNYTINEGFSGFFRDYGIVFNAHDTMADIDYPLVFDDMSIRGIFYIKQYLEKLYLENQFCKHFRSEDIERVLISYGRTYKIDYKVPLINIFEIVMNNSIFSALSGNHGRNIVISKPQYEMLERKLKNLSPSEIDFQVERAIEKIIMDLDIKGKDMLDYIYRYKPIFMTRVLNAVENGSLPNMVITEDGIGYSEAGFVFKEGAKMDDSSFRAMLHRILECKNTEEKVGIIISNINSSQDFIDILQADCLFGDELKAVFGALSDMELSILGRVVFEEELRGGLVDLLSVSNAKEELEVEWQLQYMEFIKTLSCDRAKVIQKYINTFV